MPNYHQQRLDREALDAFIHAEQARLANVYEKTQAVIRDAAENLRRVKYLYDKSDAASLDKLRTIRPKRPAILDQEPIWDWDKGKMLKFQEAQRAARDLYYQHLCVAEGGLLSKEQLSELRAAVGHVSMLDLSVQSVESGATTDPAVVKTVTDRQAVLSQGMRDLIARQTDV